MARERGFATLAAVLASACFALLAAQVARSSRSDIRSANADVVRARLSADAEAGFAIALDHIEADNPAARWDIDGRTYRTAFEGADLAITVEDERGKLPLNLLTESQARTMFERAGAAPAEAEALTSAFMDRRDPDRRRKVGAQADIVGFRAVEELADLPGMTPALYAVIAPSATVEAGDAPFVPRTATPFALEVMNDANSNSPDVIERARERAGERPALDISPSASPAPPLSLVGRALTIRVAAADGQGGRAEQATVVELTGLPAHPYVVRRRTE